MAGDEETLGVISMVGRDSGLMNSQDWYFLYQSETTMMAYYCGNVKTWHFEGFVVMSRDK